MSEIMTAPAGEQPCTLKTERFPMRDTLGTVMSRPGHTARPIRLFLKTSMNLSSIDMRLPGGMLGDSVTLRALGGSILLTTTLSPMDTPALVLVSPSILTIPLSESSGSLLKTFATTVFFPLISIMLPIVSPSSAYATGSRRALPYPASFRRVGVSTFRVRESDIGRVE